MLKPPTQTHGRTVLGKCEEPIKSGLMASVCRSQHLKILEAVSTSCSVELVLSADVFGPRRLILKSFVWVKVINGIHFVGNLSAVWSSL